MMIANPIVRVRLALLHRALLASCQAAKCNEALRCPEVQQRRHLRGVRRIFRCHLPTYRNNLCNLEPLTEMLTSDEMGRQADSLAHLWTRKMDIYKQYLPDRQKPVLLEALFNPDNDIDALLGIIDQNLETMSSFYVACSLEALDDMMRLGKCATDTVIVSPEFRRLTTRTLYKVRYFEADEVLKLMRCMSTVRLPENTLLAQAAFQMARYLLNDFNSDELRTLSTCLESLDVIDNSPKSLLLALKQAIPVAQRYQSEAKFITRPQSDAEALRLGSQTGQIQDESAPTGRKPASVQ